MKKSVPGIHRGLDVKGKVAETWCIYRVFETWTSESDLNQTAEDATCLRPLQ